jgi:hypothetical protein
MIFVTKSTRVRIAGQLAVPDLARRHLLPLAISNTWRQAGARSRLPSLFAALVRHIAKVSCFDLAKRHWVWDPPGQAMRQWQLSLPSALAQTERPHPLPTPGVGS